MEKVKAIKIFNEQELSAQEQREILLSIVTVIKEKNLSLNQAVEILDLTKEALNKKPLWS